MLDTGIDVPEVANLVFFKPVYSRIKFWQMIGRGTRLCPDLFGPADDKHDFRVFDFCFNFDFFRENPEGIEGDGGVSLRAQLFKSRVQLLTHVQATPDLDARGVMEPSALYEAPFVRVHAGGPDELFAGKSNVIDGIFEKLETLRPERLTEAG